MSQRSRNWCFTLNNYTLADVHEVDDWTYTYMVIGLEVGDEKKTPHLQGYVEFANARWAGSVHEHFDGRAHWEIRKGTAQQAADYCKKDGRFKEHGRMGPGQGARSDLRAIGEAIMDGETLASVAREYPGTFIKFHKGFAALKHVSLQHRTDIPHVTWLWGAAGTGKTRTATENHESFYIKDGSHWWDGYEQQEAVVLDDFDGNHCDYRDFLRLLDRYPYQGQVKGGYVPVNSPYIYITCEHPPTMFWTGNELAQVTRRICEVIEVKGDEYHPAEHATERAAFWAEPEQPETTEDRVTHHELPEFTGTNDDVEDDEYPLPDLEEPEDEDVTEAESDD